MSRSHLSLGIRFAIWHMRWSPSQSRFKRSIASSAYWCVRFAQGARRVRTESSKGETAGVCESPGVCVDFGGACPVQGDGLVDGHFCYYRSRGEGWSFEVWEQGATDDGDLRDGDPIFTMRRAPYFHPDGGWVHRDVSVACIAESVDAFRRFEAERRADALLNFSSDPETFVDAADARRKVRSK